MTNSRCGFGTLMPRGVADVLRHSVRLCMKIKSGKKSCWAARGRRITSLNNMRQRLPAAGVLHQAEARQTKQRASKWALVWASLKRLC